MITIQLPDNSVKHYNAGITALDVARDISEGLAQNVLAARVDGQVIDATRPLNNDAKLQLLTWNDVDGKAAMWHSSAHLMAEAIELLYPGVKFGIGPDIENGFYYDIDFGNYEISDKDFVKIENKMLELAREKQVFVRNDVSKKQALEYFEKKGDEY